MNLYLAFFMCLLFFNKISTQSYLVDSIMISWTDWNEYTNFTMIMSNANVNTYFAFAFSLDQNMGNDDVAICSIKSNTNLEMLHYYNDGKSSEPLSDSNITIGFSNIKITFDNNLVKCSFTRVKNLPDTKWHFNLNTNYYILTAYGPLNSGLPSMHNYKGASKTSFDFKENTATTSTNLPITKTSFIPQTNQSSIKISWRNSINTIDFEMTYKILNTSDKLNYFAFAISNDTQMGDDNVVACILNKQDNSISLVHNYNDGYSSNLLKDSNPIIGLSKINNSYIDGTLTCSFSREKTINSLKNYFDINKQYFILAAFGPATSAFQIQMHTKDRKSREKFNFLIDGQYATDNQIKSTTSSVPTISMTTTKSTSQGFKISWRNSQSSTEFDLIYQFSNSIKRQTSQGNYFAIGLSTDTKMGDDEVIVCILNTNNTISLAHYYNSGKSSSLLAKNNSMIGLTTISTSYTDGLIKCSFSRAKRLSTVSNYFDFTYNQFYILTAVGSVDSNIDINKHEKAGSSEQKFILLNDGEYSSGIIQTNNKSKQKAHGCLMIFTWMFLASTGILIARYYKFLLPKIKWMKVQFWFFVHRPLMISVPILSMISFLIILSELDWKWIDPDEKLEFAHSITGLITIVFSILQVFLAFFRCDNDHSQRFLFNYFHRGLGLLTFLLAVVSLFLGVFLESLSLDESAWGIMIGWTFWIIILPMFVEDTNKINSDDSKKLHGYKTLFLLTHLIVSFGLSIALIAVIGSK